MMPTSDGGLSKLRLAIGAIVLIALSGCGEPVIFYEPGEYQGQADPLMEKSESGELEGDWRERFAAVQARE